MFHVCGAAATLALFGFFSLGKSAAQKDLPRNALWEVVSKVCVPGYSTHHDPTPCLGVNVDDGIDKGFAILRDPRVTSRFLLVPTARVAGIESPDVLKPNATNYLAKAWDARTRIEEALQRTVPRNWVGLAVNSAPSRSQDQLHIHVGCIRAEVHEALQMNQSMIKAEWTALSFPLLGHRYRAIWVSGDVLGSTNPFRLLADVTGVREMGNRSLAVMGSTRANGTQGFVILSGEVDRQTGDQASSEELLDHVCRI